MSNMATIAASPPVHHMNNLDVASADHLRSYMDRIDDCTETLNEVRSHIKSCAQDKKPVSRELHKRAVDCMATLQKLQYSMKQHNTIHQESKRILRRSPAPIGSKSPGLAETKYMDSRTQSGSRRKTFQGLPLTRARGPYHVIQSRIDHRVKQARNRFKSLKQQSPV